MGKKCLKIGKKWPKIEFFEERSNLKRYPKKKRGDAYHQRIERFRLTCNNLFDIRADKTRSVSQGNLWGVQMAERDEQFYELQKLCPQQGYCTTFVERKWKIMMEKSVYGRRR